MQKLCIWSMAFRFHYVNSAVRRSVAVFAAKQTMATVPRKSKLTIGFHGHLLMTATGVITGFTLTAASASEREAL
jgi:hypothetical protein